MLPASTLIPTAAMSQRPRPFLFSLLIILMLTFPTAHARQDPGAIALGLHRLAHPGRVLYIAAHPDDENTRLLAWLVNHLGIDAAYLSLTRGDGGQNLIGSELGSDLGAIRTYELLAARAYDGAAQFFTRAIDFGYSKSAQESLDIWGHREILSDVVRVIRTYQPDLIITRFSVHPPNHGHHTASALLAKEAFLAAADPTAFPEHNLPPHQALRIFENKSHWRMRPDEDLSQYLLLEVGAYSPFFGLSIPELAARSRSMHKSQGFGASATLGPQFEYFEPHQPETWPHPLPPAQKDPLHGLDFTWARYPGTTKLRHAIANAQRRFRADDPVASLPSLKHILTELQRLPDTNPYKATKITAVESLMLAVTGTTVRAQGPKPTVIPDGPLDFILLATTHAPQLAIALDGAPAHPVPPGDLLQLEQTLPQHLLTDAPYSNPGWLQSPPAGPGLYAAPAPIAIQPDTLPPLHLSVRYELAGHIFHRPLPLTYHWTDPIHGARHHPVALIPPITLQSHDDRTIFPNGTPQTLRFTLSSHHAPQSGRLTFHAPDGWHLDPPHLDISLDADSSHAFTLRLTPPRSGAGQLSVTWNGQPLHRLDTLDHPHIPRLTRVRPFTRTLRAFPLSRGVQKLGLIPGAGDKVGENLIHAGYDLTLLDAQQLQSLNLGDFDAILIGIRAYNTTPELQHAHPALMRYVAQGGTLIVQYQTSNQLHPLLTDHIGPAPFRIDRGRVTDAEATLHWRDEADPLRHHPNRLTPADFDGWVQERGLYFAEDWAPLYRPVLSMRDPGEENQDGALLVARHGQGHFVYTGLSFFRQLPAGVPGAYRLLANLLSLGTTP